jgi:hypothetical protein
MELQVVFGSRAYCFVESAEELAKPVHLVIDEYVELRDTNGDFVTQERGQNARFDLSIAEANFLINQLRGAIAEAQEKAKELAQTA